MLGAPDGRFGADPSAGRDALLLTSLGEALEGLAEDLGPEMSAWIYGQEKFHHIMIRHMLSGAVSDELRVRLDLGPLPRGGSGNTPNATGNGANQTSGASFRMIADTSNWDNTVGTNNPGQSGDPDSPHYADLFATWAGGQYFPAFFTRAKIESVTEKVTILEP